MSFWDGAVENGVASIGGVLIASSGICQAFGAVVPEEIVHGWKTKLNQEQVIGQAELFPFVVARLIWSKYLRGRRVIYFVDNEAARLGLIKSYSPVLPSLKLILSCINWDYANGSSCGTMPGNSQCIGPSAGPGVVCPTAPCHPANTSTPFLPCRTPVCGIIGNPMVPFPGTESLSDTGRALKLKSGLYLPVRKET